MNKKYYTLIAIVSLLVNSLYAQDTYERNTTVDVQHYIFNLSLNDGNNEISGEALVTVNFDKLKDTFALDLIAKSDNYGMEVTEVFEGEIKANYKYENNKILIIPALHAATW